MNLRAQNGWALLWIHQASLILFALVILVFSILSPAFFQKANALNILVQTASTGILAVGMTLVLLTAGVDLSVGSIMFVAAAVAGKVVLQGGSLALATTVMLGVGALYGALNALFITRLAVLAFVVTLATRYFGRGLGLRITETRSIHLPESFYQLGTANFAGVPLPVWIFAGIVLAAHLLLTRTPFGRHIYAVGADIEAARKAGLNPPWILFWVYVLCGICAAAASLVALSQAPSVSPTFGNNREFMAIAAAVLGGTSLFGGRGAVFPGTVLGAVLIQTIDNGLNVLNVDPYLYPLITSTVILSAVLLDALRTRIVATSNRRRIFVEPDSSKA